MKKYHTFTINKSMMFMSRHDKEIIAIGLYFKCPITNDNPVKCQLHEIRKLNYIDFKKYLNSLTDEQLDNLIFNHENCSHNNINNNC